MTVPIALSGPLRPARLCGSRHMPYSIAQSGEAWTRRRIDSGHPVSAGGGSWLVPWPREAGPLPGDEHASSDPVLAGVATFACPVIPVRIAVVAWGHPDAREHTAAGWRRPAAASASTAAREAPAVAAAASATVAASTSAAAALARAPLKGGPADELEAARSSAGVPPAAVLARGQAAVAGAGVRRARSRLAKARVHRGRVLAVFTG